MFKITAESKKTKARVGELKTKRGVVKTPIFMPCATRGVIRSVSFDEARQAGHTIMLVNAYHLYLSPGLEVIKKFGGIHNFCGWKGPILCDSGGFQVFSLNPKIGDSGVRFRSHIDGKEHRFTPEKVWEINQVLGSDIAMPLDDCPSGKANRKRTEQAVNRTHRWLEKTIGVRKKTHLRGVPRLFGIIQGGVYQDLREKSARFISGLYERGKIDGIAVGGVAVGEDKQKIRKVIKWMGEMLPKQAPKYLMGVGEPEDIEYAVKQGFDMFDCVLPTRLGRHGSIYQVKKDLYGKLRFERTDITKRKYKLDKEWAYIHYLLKIKEMQGARYVSLHNLRVYGELMKELQKSIKTGKV